MHSKRVMGSISAWDRSRVGLEFLLFSSHSRPVGGLILFSAFSNMGFWPVLWHIWFPLVFLSSFVIRRMPFGQLDSCSLSGVGLFQLQAASCVVVRHPTRCNIIVPSSLVS
jgi:hypothetical protein